MEEARIPEVFSQAASQRQVMASTAQAWACFLLITKSLLGLDSGTRKSYIISNRCLQYSSAQSYGMTLVLSRGVDLAPTGWVCDPIGVCGRHIRMPSRPGEKGI